MTSTATATKHRHYADLYEKAHQAGWLAAGRTRPAPMVVQQHAHPFADDSPVVKEWVIDEGVCGFAWIVVQPGTSSFARWLKSKGLASKHWQGGVSIWVSEFGQSMERKQAYARAFAYVLKADPELEGLTIYAGSRMD